MATTNLYLKYRPVKIGFLVRDGSIEDLVKVAGINTLLWGGIYNPIIPVSKETKDFSSQLIKLFSVDILFPVHRNTEINEIIENNPFLRDPGHFAENIFYEDWHSKKNLLGFLDSINIVNYLWEKEFKNRSTSYKSNCRFIEWENSDQCSNLFSIIFGYFPSNYNLKEDFKTAFRKGLRSKDIKISSTGNIFAELSKTVSPIGATSFELEGYGGRRNHDGIYIGSEKSFKDLANFWNLRATGSLIQFLPKESIKRFAEYTKEFVKRFDDIPSKHPNIDDSITIFFDGDEKEIKDVINPFKSNKSFCYYKYSEAIWNGLNIKPLDFYFDWQQSLGNVDKIYGKFNLTTVLPEKKFLNVKQERNIDSQQLAVSVNSVTEFSFPNHTLKPPFIRSLNEFYSREIAVDPWELRIEKDGIALIIKTTDQSLSLYPLSHQKLIERIFELTGFKTKISQAGLLAKQIIQSMRDSDPLEACRVFKITGVRKLIHSLKAKDKIKWSKIIKIIGENNFDKFKKLHIEARDNPNLSPPDVINFLLKKKIFKPEANFFRKILRERMAFKCKNCGLEEIILVKDFEGSWLCPYCKHDQYMPPNIIESFKKHKDKYWEFVKAGLFSKDNHQEGAIPVIISLLTFKRIFHDLIYSTSMNVEKEKKCEIDFCILQYERGDGIQLGISECKSEYQKITKRDVENLKYIQDEMAKIDIDCYIIFSKTAMGYHADEIQLFKELESEQRNFIILSNKELEPYEPYWELEETEQLPEKYALDMEGMLRNSQFLYLKQQENEKN